eukprot:TRINITY_DN13154_c0_g1_i25.p1 TRINITY_DN13154_c0_g1~~TRINITY_DN13154_c0_g1_i25.p1  ORF type:complete len:513 (+),score=160.86 TRINITY_DN13154_c0_g1_i25:1142-2680(+)
MGGSCSTSRSTAVVHADNGSNGIVTSKSGGSSHHHASGSSTSHLSNSNSTTTSGRKEKRNSLSNHGNNKTTDPVLAVLNEVCSQNNLSGMIIQREQILLWRQTLQINLYNDLTSLRTMQSDDWNAMGLPRRLFKLLQQELDGESQVVTESANQPESSSDTSAGEISPTKLAWGDEFQDGRGWGSKTTEGGTQNNSRRRSSTGGYNSDDDLFKALKETERIQREMKEQSQSSVETQQHTAETTTTESRNQSSGATLTEWDLMKKEDKEGLNPQDKSIGVDSPDKHASLNPQQHQDNVNASQVDVLRASSDIGQVTEPGQSGISDSRGSSKHKQMSSSSSFKQVMPYLPSGISIFVEGCQLGQKKTESGASSSSSSSSSGLASAFTDLYKVSEDSSGSVYAGKAGEEPTDALLDQLSGNQICQANLQRCDLESAGVETLLHNLIFNTSLQTLNLEGNHRLGTKGTKEIFQNLGKLSHLHHLNVAGCGVDEESMQVLADQLGDNDTLKELVLRST